jgi:hypothetical protein
MHACMKTRVFVCAMCCACMGVHRAYMHACYAELYVRVMYSCMRACMYACMKTSMCVSLKNRIYAYRVFMCACMYENQYVRVVGEQDMLVVYSCVHACMKNSERASCSHVCMYETRICSSCIHACMCVCMHGTTVCAVHAFMMYA